MWFRLASHLGIPLQELQQKTTSSEFVEWCLFMEKDTNLFHRQDYYLAQIACEVRRGYVKTPKDVKFSDFLLKFKTERSEPKEDKTERLSRTKSFWLAATGVNRKN